MVVVTNATMKNAKLLGTAAAFALSFSFASPALADPMTQMDLVTLKRLAAPTASPDGRWVVYQLRETDYENNKGKLDLYLLDLKNPKVVPQKIASAADKNEHDPVFAADGHLYYLSNQSGSDQIWRISLPGGTPTQVSDLNYDVAGFKISPKSNKVLIWADRPIDCANAQCEDVVRHPPNTPKGSGRVYDQMFVRHWDTWINPDERSRLFQFDMTDGKMIGTGQSVVGSLVGDTPSKPFGGGEEIAWAADGNSAFFTLRLADKEEPRSTNLDIYHTMLDGSEPRNLTANNKAMDTLPTPSPNGKWLAYVAMARPGYESDRQVLMLRDIATGATKALTQGWDRSVGSIAWAPDNKSILVTAQDTLDHPAFRVDVASGKVTRLTKSGTANNTIPLADGSMLYTLNGIQAPDDLYRMAKDGKVTRLTTVNPNLENNINKVTVERYSFAGANGDTVWGMITKPVGSTGKLPVAFVVHGGPQGSFGDGWSFRWNPKVMAARGYAVVSVDFHGSTGYGQAFTDSINKDWGGKPLTDLKLGLAAAAAKDAQVDTTNACALGASYGGYMMNWIAGQWPDQFKCLVQHDGVFDARAMAYETEELWFDEWEHGGAYFEVPEEYEKWNPVNHVTKWKTPMLVITGEKDFRIPYTQGLAAFTALQRRDIPSRLVVFPDENHWVLKPKNSVQWHNEVFKWMGQWTGRNTDQSGAK